MHVQFGGFGNSAEVRFEEPPIPSASQITISAGDSRDGGRIRLMFDTAEALDIARRIILAVDEATAWASAHGEVYR